MGENIQTVAEKARNRMDEGRLQETTSQKWVLVNLIIIVCILVFAAHFPTLSARALIIDDDQYLTKNLLVRNPSWSSARRFLTEVLEPSTVKGYYQPLTMISLMGDYAFGGRPYNLKPFHRTSLLLHMANTALVILLLYSLFGQVWVAVGVGLLFGIHPMTIEAISWVSQRKTVLAAFFALCSLVLYVRFARKSSWKLYVVCLVMYILALMSKPTAMPLPVLMLLLDYWPLGRMRRQAILEKLPFFVVGGIFAIITYISQSRTASVALLGEYNVRYIPLVFCHNIIFYLYKIVWPVNLSPHYAYNKPIVLSNPMVLGGIIGTCIIVNLMILSLRRTRGVLTGCLFFLVALLPTMGIIRFTNVIVGDRYVYLASVGLLIVLALLLCWFCSTGSVRKPKAGRVTMVMFVLMLAGAEAIATRKYLVYWYDAVTLYKYMLRVTPHAVLLHNNLGIALVSQGKLDEAANHFRQVIQIAPHHVQAHVNLGNVLLTHEKFDEAISHYHQALETEPDFGEAHYHLAVALMRVGQLDESLKHFREATRLTANPPWYFLHGLAWILATHPNSEVRDASEAIQLAKRAQELTLTKYHDMKVLDTLAAAYAATGQFDLAIATVRKAIALVSPGHQDEVTQQIRKRLELYKQGKPFRLDLSKRKTQVVPDSDKSNEEQK